MSVRASAFRLTDREVEPAGARDDGIGGWADGKPSVFGTPSLLHLMETTAAAVLNPYLPSGRISVGARVVAAAKCDGRTHETAALAAETLPETLPPPAWL